MPLRPLQVRFVNAVYEALREVNSVCAVAPTGFGKGFVIGHWCHRIAECGRRALVVANRRILIDQIESQCREHGVASGIIMSDSPRNDDAPIQIASIQTLVRRKWQDLPQFDWLILDEAHREDQAYQKLIGLAEGKKAVGLTATPLGRGGRNLKRRFDRIIEPVRNSELVAQGLLLATRLLAPVEPDVTGVSVTAGEYSQKGLARRIQECHIFADVFRWWAPFADRQTLCFVPRVAFARGIAQQFSERGYPAAVLVGSTTSKERHEIVEAFRTRRLRVLVAVDVLREGFDAPAAQVGIDAQPCLQFRTWWQKLGRVKRPFPGQNTAVWLDFAGNYWRHAMHPDEDPPWDLFAKAEGSPREVLSRMRQGVCWRCGSDVISAGRCLQCGAEAKRRKPAWACEACGYTLRPHEQVREGRCPNCGHQIRRVIRRVRMAGGQMRVISAKEHRRKRKQKTGWDQLQQIWDSCRYIAMHKNKTLSFARWLFQKRTGLWPPAGLRCCPERRDSIDWQRKPDVVYPHMRKRHARSRTA